MRTRASLAASVVAALGATACCFAPLLLVSIGLGGAWVARMQDLSALQPVFIVLTLSFMGFAFQRLFVQPRRCAPGDACAAPRVLGRQRIAFWVVAAAIALMFAFPFVSQHFI